MTKSKFLQLSPQLQELLRTTARVYHQDLIERGRAKNERAIAALTQKGNIQAVPVNKAERDNWIKLAHQVEDELVGSVYSRQLFNDVKRLLSEYPTRK